MKFNFKKLTATATLAAIVMTGAVFATENAVPETATPTPFTAKVETINNVEMLPLRSIAEHFGYTVEWHEEEQSVSMTKGAHYITFAIDKDLYSFSKMAPSPLGAAPVLFGGDTTYVPSVFFTELIGLGYKTLEDGVELFIPNTVTVVEISEEGILVDDENFGQVLVLIGEDTKITADGEEASADLIAVDSLINVEYSEQMTRSIPPQTTAVSIEILNVVREEEEDLSVDEKPIASVTVVSIEEDGALLVNDTVRGEVIVFVTDETVITKGEQAATSADIEAGMELTIEYAPHMTMSIPPQTAAVSIQIAE